MPVDEPEPPVATREQRAVDDEQRYYARAMIAPPAHVDPLADYDALWRKQPQRLGFMQMARVTPGLAAQFRGRVPDQFVAQVEWRVVEVSCPCGQAPRCEWNVPTPCECNRVFVYIGGSVWVAYVEAAVVD